MSAKRGDADMSHAVRDFANDRILDVGATARNALSTQGCDSPWDAIHKNVQ
jgi:hypothetical protein